MTEVMFLRELPGRRERVAALGRLRAIAGETGKERRHSLERRLSLREHRV